MDVAAREMCLLVSVQPNQASRELAPQNAVPSLTPASVRCRCLQSGQRPSNARQDRPANRRLSTPPRPWENMKAANRRHCEKNRRKASVRALGKSTQNPKTSAFVLSSVCCFVLTLSRPSPLASLSPFPVPPRSCLDSLSSYESLF